MRLPNVLLIGLFAIAGCSPEAAGTAATVGKLQASQAEAARAQQQQIQQKLGEALKAGEAAASAAVNQ